MNNQTRQYIEDAVKVDLSGLISNGFVTGGRKGISTGSINGKKIWSIGWRVSNGLDKLQVDYTCQNENYSHSIVLSHQPVHFGGHRTYLVCPVCNQKRKHLYIRLGDIGCRKCQRLHYKAQSKSPKERSFDRYFRLAEKVDLLDIDAYSKRKFQHWKTYARITDEMNLIFKQHFGPLIRSLFKL